MYVLAISYQIPPQLFRYFLEKSRNVFSIKYIQAFFKCKKDNIMTGQQFDSGL